jgi:tetratricopeptide (TPR) repeat protein
MSSMIQCGNYSGLCLSEVECCYYQSSLRIIEEPFMSNPKKITPNVIPIALDKADRYRLLNEPREAESICTDVLDVDPNNKEAQITLLLAITDQFEVDFHAALQRAKNALQTLEGEYEKAYYEGIIHERWAKAQLARGVPDNIARGWFLEAMHGYENAEKLSPPNDPDPVLRWNTCLRFMQRLAVQSSERGREGMIRDVEASFGDDVPPR